MRRWTLWGTMWLLGTAGSVALAWCGVMVVAGEVTDRRPSPLGERTVSREAAQLPEAPPLEAAAPPPAAPGPATPPGPDADPASPPPPDVASAPAARAGPRRAAPPDSGRPPPPAPAAPRPAQDAPAGDDPDPPPTTTKTIPSKGGTVSVRYEEGSATLVWAKPNPGFTMNVRSHGPRGVDVRFEGEDHQSRIMAWWDNGPRSSVREHEG